MISRSRHYIYCSTSTQPSRTCVWRLVLLRLARARTRVRRSGGIRLQAVLRHSLSRLAGPLLRLSDLDLCCLTAFAVQAGSVFASVSFFLIGPRLFSLWEMQCVLAAAGGPCHCTAAFAVQSRPRPAAACLAARLQFSWPRSRELLHL